MRTVVRAFYEKGDGTEMIYIAGLEVQEARWPRTKPSLGDIRRFLERRLVADGIAFTNLQIVAVNDPVDVKWLEIHGEERG